MNQLMKAVATILITSFGVTLSALVVAFAILGLLYAMSRELCGYIFIHTIVPLLFKQTDVQFKPVSSNDQIVLSGLRISKTIPTAKVA